MILYFKDSTISHLLLLVIGVITLVISICLEVRHRRNEVGKMNKEEILHELLDTTESIEIINIFEEEYEMDDQSDEKKGDYLINLYINGTPKNRIIIDDVFITLCGWSFQSLCLKLKK